MAQGAALGSEWLRGASLVTHPKETRDLVKCSSSSSVHGPEG